MITPQLTEQYGQVLRVSVVRAIFSVLACAKAGVASNPNAVSTAPPLTADCRKLRLEISLWNMSLASGSIRPQGASELLRRGSEPDEIELNLNVFTIAGPQIERRRRDLVGERHGDAKARQIDALHVVAARIARVDPHVIEGVRLKISELPLVFFAAVR